MTSFKTVCCTVDSNDELVICDEESCFNSHHLSCFCKSFSISNRQARKSSYRWRCFLHPSRLKKSKVQLIDVMDDSNVASEDTDLKADAVDDYNYDFNINNSRLHLLTNNAKKKCITKNVKENKNTLLFSDLSENDSLNMQMNSSSDSDAEQYCNTVILRNRLGKLRKQKQDSSKKTKQKQKFLVTLHVNANCLHLQSKK